jgi:hypothetical protein
MDRSARRDAHLRLQPRGHADQYRWRWPKQFSRYHAVAANAHDFQDLRRLQAGLPIKP